jgi:hypothetical protein
MTTAIICPKYPMNPSLLRELERIESGKVLKIIGTNKKRDLSVYDKTIIVYQYSLSSINKGFTEFVENNSDLKNVSMVIDIPQFHIDDDPGWVSGTNQLISFFNSKYNKDGREAAVINAEQADGSTQKKYAEKLNLQFLNRMDGRNLSKHPVTVVFNECSRYHMRISDRRANLYIIMGMLAVPVGIFLLYFAIVYQSPVSRAAGLPCFGPILLYMAYRSKRFLHWNGDGEVGKNAS